MAPPLERSMAAIAEQERTLRFPYFSAVEAFDLGCFIRAKFLTAQMQGHFREQGCVVSISTMTGNILFACVLGEENQVGPNNWRWVEGKKEVVRLHNRSSFYVHHRTKSYGKEPEEFEYGGAFPIWLRGCPSAPIAVAVISGLAQEDDHKLIVDAITEYIPRMRKEVA